MTGLDTRIGYPNEHLANTNEMELASPMYSTGIGLVLKGFEELSKYNQPETKIQETPTVEPKIEQVKETPVTGHSNPEKKGSFFSSVLLKAKEKIDGFFED